MTILRELRAFPRPVWILFAGTFVNRFGSFVIPFLALYLTRSGYSIAQGGLAIGIYGCGHFVASWSGGHLADRIGRRNTIALSMFGSAASMMLLSASRGFVWISVVTFLTGAFAELYRPASSALIADLVPQEQRVMAFGMYRFAINLGFALGPATAGFLADRSFKYLFYGDALTSLIYGIIALAALPHGVQTSAKDERTGEALRTAARDMRFVVLLIAAFLVTMVDFQSLSTFPLYVQSLGYPTRVYGLLLSVNGVLIIAFELLLTVWVRRFPAQPVIATGFFLAGIGFALTGLARSIPALTATVVVWTLGEMVAHPMAAAYVAQIAPERYRGRYMGLFATTWSLGVILGPPLGTWAFAVNPSIVWVTSGVLGIVSALLLLGEWRFRRAL